MIKRALQCWVWVASLITPIALAQENVPPQFQTCVACHGQKGQGNSALSAPSIAGQQAWYISRQLNNFRDGLRGAHEKDVMGKQMVAFASQFTDPAQVESLAKYLESLPAPSTKGQESGDMMNGSRYYQAKCGACHGGKAEGNKAFNAPRLSGQSAAYLLKQMQNFQQGIRGTHANDKLGKQMALMAKTVTDEQQLNDIIFYITEQQ